MTGHHRRNTQRQLSSPIAPKVRDIRADGDTVLVHWEGTAKVKDGSTYRNEYLWIFKMKDGKVVAGTAFLDTQTYKAVLHGRAPDRN